MVKGASCESRHICFHEIDQKWSNCKEELTKEHLIEELDEASVCVSCLSAQVNHFILAESKSHGGR